MSCLGAVGSCGHRHYYIVAVQPPPPHLIYTPNVVRLPVVIGCGTEGSSSKRFSTESAK